MIFSGFVTCVENYLNFKKKLIIQPNVIGGSGCNIQYFCMSKNKVAQNPSNNSG
jgi:hypothetical protein